MTAGDGVGAHRAPLQNICSVCGNGRFRSRETITAPTSERCVIRRVAPSSGRKPVGFGRIVETSVSGLRLWGVMKLFHLRFIALALLLTVSLSAGSRETAFQARAMLGPEIWSRVLRVENTRAGGRSRYPAEFHALVVAFQGILWLYTEFDGTQNLSLYAGRLEQDIADLGSLLRAVEPGLTRFEDVTEQRRDPVLAGSRRCAPAFSDPWRAGSNCSANPSRRPARGCWPIICPRDGRGTWCSNTGARAGATCSIRSGREMNMNYPCGSRRIRSRWRRRSFRLGI